MATAKRSPSQTSRVMMVSFATVTTSASTAFAPIRAIHAGSMIHASRRRKPAAARSMTIARPESGEAGARAIARIPATSVPIAARGSGRGRPIDARARSASKRRLKRTWRPVSAIRTAGNASPRPRLSSSARAIGVSASTARVRRTSAAHLRSAITLASSAWTVYRVCTAEEIHPFAIRRATNAWDASAIAIVGAILPCVNPRASGACSACPALNAARTMKGKVFV